MRSPAINPLKLRWPNFIRQPFQPFRFWKKNFATTQRKISSLRCNRRITEVECGEAGRSWHRATKCSIHLVDPLRTCEKTVVPKARTKTAAPAKLYAVV